MECFAHPESSVVGICKSCGKAVCRSCAQDLGFAIACSKVCAEEAAALKEMNQRVKRMFGIGAAPRKLSVGVIMLGLFAVFYMGFGIYQSLQKDEPDWFLLIFGCIFAGIAVMAYRRAKEIGIQF